MSAPEATGPDTPASPDAPTGPDTPAGPDAPTGPDTTAGPGAPAGPDMPVGPDAPTRPDAALPPAERGRLIRRASLAGTGVFAVTAALAAAVDGGPLRGLAAAVAVTMFALGSLAYLAGYAGAVQRSRTRVIGMAGLVFLSDCAPTAVRRQLLGATAAQVVVALVTASIRPFTPLAFGVLAPVFGLGLQCLWAARHGDFPARPTPPRRPASSRPAPTSRPAAPPGQPAGPEAGPGTAPSSRRPSR